MQKDNISSNKVHINRNCEFHSQLRNNEVDMSTMFVSKQLNIETELMQSLC